MRILIISQYFLPDITAAAFRIGEMTDELVKQGHDVKVITSYPHRGESDNFSEQELTKDKNIYRVKLAAFNHKGLLNYLMHYFSFVFKSIWISRKIIVSKWRPQVIWTTSPPLFTGISGYVLSILLRSPLVLDIRDIWPDSAVAAGQISQDGKAFKIGKVLEKWLYSRAEHLTCVSVPMADYLRNTVNKPVSVIYNGISLSSPLIKKNAGKENIILYAGNIGRVQGLEMLIEGFAELYPSQKNKQWKFVLIGDGVLKKELEQKIKQLKMEQAIIIKEAMPKALISKEMHKARVLVFNLQDDDVFKMTIPSKVFDYMAIGNPIISGLLGEGKSILEETGGNIVFYPGNKESFKQSLTQMLDNINSIENKSHKNIELVVSNYTRKKATESLCEIFSKFNQEDIV